MPFYACRRSRGGLYALLCLQEITGGLYAVSRPAGDHGRTLCPSMPCRSSRGGLYAVSRPAVAAPGQQVRQDVRRPPVSCQPVSDFVTFGLIQPTSCRKSKKIGLKAARTENKKPLEIFSSLKNVMKRKKPAEKKQKQKSRTFGSSKQKSAAEKQRNNSAPVRINLNSVYEKIFLKIFKKVLTFIIPWYIIKTVDKPWYTEKR